MLDAQPHHAALATSDETIDQPLIPDVTSVERGIKELLASARRVLAELKQEPIKNASMAAELEEAREIFASLGLALQSVPATETLAVAEDGTWFQHGGQARVDMGRRGAVRRILLALANQRTQKPSSTLSVHDLFQIGWPGERIPYESQVRRVYTAIWTLRTLGLDSFLLTRNEGYMFDPKKGLHLG